MKEEDVDYEMDVNLLNETELIIGSNKLESKDPYALTFDSECKEIIMSHNDEIISQSTKVL